MKVWKKKNKKAKGILSGRKLIFHDHKKKQAQNSRVNVIIAIIFILGIGIIAKLYQLQVLNTDYYVAQAARQQLSSSKIIPTRGSIYIQDSNNGQANGNLFPLATDKEFATIFAKPKNITDPMNVANQLYEIIDKPKIEANIAWTIATDESLASETPEFRNLKQELEVKAVGAKTINSYLAILSKKNDPYEPIAKNVDEDTLNKIKENKLEGIDYVLEPGRYYPEKNIGAHLLGFVGYSGNTKVGRYGLEGYFEKELSGTAGLTMANRSATGDLMLLDDKQNSKAEDGSDIFLTINRSIQFEACQKLSEAVSQHGASGGSVIVMNPKTGEIIAMCSVPDYDPNNYRNVSDINVYNNPVIFSQFEPGSTFKSITMAAALDQGKVTPSTTYLDKGEIFIEGWPKPIRNSDFATKGGHGVTTMNTVLEKSLNLGAIYSMQQVGPQVFADYVKKFGFGEKTGIELETESSGNISNLTAKKVRPINAATASFGQGISVTALQMVSSYATIANGGIMMKPYIAKEIVGPDGIKTTTEPRQVRRVISQRAALLLTGMMVNTVETGTAKRAKVPGYYVAGKTGTAQVAVGGGYSLDNTIQSFIGYTPANDPKFVMLTELNNPGDHYAESSAVPLFGDIAKFILNYYQVPFERSLDEKVK